MNNHSVKFAHIIITQHVGIACHSVERYKNITPQQAPDAVIKSNNIGKIVMVKKLDINLKDFVIITKNIIKRAHHAVMRSGNLYEPSLKLLIIKLGKSNTRA